MRKYIKNDASENNSLKIFEDYNYFEWFEFILKLFFV